MLPLLRWACHIHDRNGVKRLLKKTQQNEITKLLIKLQNGGR